MKDSYPDKPPPLGDKVQKPQQDKKEPEWRPVPGKPHLYEDKDGRYKYDPPIPT